MASLNGLHHIIERAWRYPLIYRTRIRGIARNASFSWRRSHVVYEVDKVMNSQPNTCISVLDIEATTPSSTSCLQLVLRSSCHIPILPGSVWHFHWNQRLEGKGQAAIAREPQEPEFISLLCAHSCLLCECLMLNGIDSSFLGFPPGNEAITDRQQRTLLNVSPPIHPGWTGTFSFIVLPWKKRKK